MAADKIDLRQSAQALEQIQQASAQGFSTATALQSALGLDSETTLQLLRVRQDKKGMANFRYRMMYKNVPVWGEQVVVSGSRKGIHRIHGTAVAGIAQDVVTVKPKLSAAQALEMMKQRKTGQIGLAANTSFSYENETSELVVYVDEKDNQAKLSYGVRLYRQ